MGVELLIKPEIGRTLHFHANGTQPHAARAGAAGPLAAKIVHVHSDRMINVVVWNANGESFGVTSVELVHPEDATADRAGFFCSWMPWQVEQAEKVRTFKDAQEKIRKRLEETGAIHREQVAALGGVNPLAGQEVKTTPVEELAKLAKEHGMPVTVSVANDNATLIGSDCSGANIDAHIKVAKELEAEKGESLPVDPKVEGPAACDLNGTLPGPTTEAPKENKFGFWGKK